MTGRPARAATVPTPTPVGRVDDPSDWERLVLLLDELIEQQITDLTYHELADELAQSSYRDVSVEEFIERSRMAAIPMIRGVQQRRMPNAGDDGAALQATGRSRALRAVELSDLVRITLVAQVPVASYLSEMAHQRGISNETIVEMLQYLDAWNNWSLLEMIAGYQETAIELIKRDQRRQDLALRQLLGGGLTPVEIQRAAAEASLDIRETYHVLRAVPGEIAFNEVRRALLICIGHTSTEPSITTMYGDMCLVLADVPQGDVAFLVGVSPRVPVSELAEGFRLATRSVDAARQVGITGLVSLDDLSITASVSADQEVAQILKQRYLDPLLDNGAAGQAIIDTVSEFIRRRRSVAETSAAMFLHVNTVRYRLERFESMTACSLKDMRTLAEVWCILHLHGH
ncbi:PucR family transcriptional regulator [Microbacterium lacus]|uniref:PucR family transcriptional regulator n=1 Tax=Microbacterium lacus TaxID=415217 RepID=A0ABP4SZH1_9MICO